MNITIDDTSPQIRYHADEVPWGAEHKIDRSAPDYYLQTYYTSRMPNDTATFSFRAPNIYVLASKRDNHGLYTVSLDGMSALHHDGYNAGNFMMQELYSAQNMSPEVEHTVVLQNKGDENDPSASEKQMCWLDIDLIVLSSDVEPDTIVTKTIDDTDAAFTFSQEWITDIQGSRQRYNNTATTSRTRDASVELKFQGMSVQVFGSLDADHGDYSVSLDGDEPMVLNGSFYKYITSVSLYAATGHPEGEHTLRFVNLGNDNTTVFDIDYAVINSTFLLESTQSTFATTPATSALPSATSFSSTATSTPLEAQTTASQPDSTSVQEDPTKDRTAAIIGGLAGALVGLALLTFCVYYLNRRRKNKIQQRQVNQQRMLDAMFVRAGVSVVPTRDGDTNTEKSFGDAEEQTVWMSDGTEHRSTMLTGPVSVNSRTTRM